MGYIIKNKDTGKYVAPRGSKKSYTSNALNARRFPSRDAALNDCCGNEMVINFEELCGPMN